MEISTTKQFDLHRRMVRIRLFEEAAGRLAEANRLPGFLHLYVGEEAVASGVCGALNDDDHITSTHRGHGHLVAKGGDFNRMMAELMGKATGYCKGKGGSMHISDTSLGMLGANGIVGAGSPIAVGAAFANRYRGRGQVAVAFFGDGSTNIGAFHEAANMACALHLPIVFACENNEYGEFTPRHKTMAITDIVDRAAGYGMPGVIVDGMDVIAVHEAAVEAVERARQGGGPSLIEAKTYRYYNHHGIQNLGLKYRPDEEVAAWKQRDPIFTFEDRMIENGVATREKVDEIWAELRQDIETAIQFADDSPYPTPDQIMVDVYTKSSTSSTSSTTVGTKS
ncbi:MAG: thiamine pyrophosphate-dependent dehydrogenase E1 component subunit alpha [Actinobacteria bacterium]|jgi:TPP-dependent pyruvate/acetoin dehydrogenase alpha subunit|nr:thiamine pyrophosphate-dependent dehydrogenase E1 component subunit alpha [Actinomycetota bacterium]